MPVDLDDMFTTLGRHADTIPLAPAARARLRGQQRTRTRAMVAAAAAVCLIAAVGATAWRDRHPDRPPTPAATLRPVGTPIDFGGQIRTAAADAGGDGRLYTAWQALDGRISLNAVDLRTGAVDWPARRLPSRSSETLSNVVALPRAVVVFAGPEDAANPASTMYVYDPADGRPRWQAPYEADANDYVFHRSVLVRMSAETGVTEAVDWVTGATRWRLPAPADRPVRTLGTWLPPADDGPALAIGLTDDRLVQVTQAGKVQVRDITTGALRRTVASVPPDKDPRTFVAFDGWLYNDEHECCEPKGYRIRATDLRGDRGGTSVLLSEGPGHELGYLRPCGWRLCVLDRVRGGGTTLSAIDLVSRERLWRVGTADDAGGISASHGYTLVGGAPDGDVTIFDQSGERVFSTRSPAVQWLGTDALILLPLRGAGPVSEVSLPDGRVTPLGELPATSDRCVSTADRLACPTSTSLRLWSLTG